jgi:hypothetical protein
MNSVELANRLINRAKNLQRFQIHCQANGSFPKGVVPFDMVVKNHVITCTVFATSEPEARKMVQDWLNDHT